MGLSAWWVFQHEEILSWMNFSDSNLASSELSAKGGSVLAMSVVGKFCHVSGFITDDLRCG